MKRLFVYFCVLVQPGNGRNRLNDTIPVLVFFT